jgi:hypothetical protein
MKAQEVFAGSDRAVTRRYLARLENRGSLGFIAASLFRAQKASTRAKEYHGGIRGVASYRDLSYDRKQSSIVNLVNALQKDGEALGIVWGWKWDPTARRYKPHWVIYIDLPQGQVSFHSPERGEGPDYPGEWDKGSDSEKRILAFCDAVFDKPEE